MRIDHESILKQTFLKRFRGYDPNDVDTYLQILAKDFKEMENELEQLQREVTLKNELIRKLKAEVQSGGPAPETKTKKAEKALEVTQELIDKTRTQAAKQKSKVKTEVQQLKNDIQRLKEDKKKFLDNLRSNNRARYQPADQKTQSATPRDDSSDHKE